MFKKNIFIAIILGIFLLAACSPGGLTSDPGSGSGDPADDARLVIYSGRSEALLQPVLEAFSEAYPEIEISLKAGSNSELANAILEEQANPQADVFITTEVFTAQALAMQGVFQPYQPEAAISFPTGYVSPDNLWVGLTMRARIIMYNTDLVSESEVPTSIDALTDEVWRGQVATTSSTNGSMLAQIASMRQILGDEATEAWLRDLINNDTTFFGGHTDVRKAVGAGEFALGLVNHYYYHLQLAEGSNVGVVYPDQGEDQIGLLTNATAAAVIRDANNPRSAETFIDFLLSETGQRLFAEQNYEYPILSGVATLAEIQPLDNLAVAEINVALAAEDLDETFDLIDRVGMP